MSRVYKTTHDGFVPARIYIVQTAYLVGLIAALIAYVDSTWLQTIVPRRLGPIPIGVAWFGSLGGVLISVEGSLKHRRDWDRTMHAWHYLRPLVGMTLGVVSYLLFVVVVAATGTTPVTHGTLAYYLVGFVVGYREETFRSLIKRATDVLLGEKASRSAGEGSTTSGPESVDQQP